MEKEPKPHVFVEPHVIEIHIQKGIPMPAGTAKLVWVLNQLFKNENGESP